MTAAALRQTVTAIAVGMTLAAASASAQQADRSDAARIRDALAAWNEAPARDGWLGSSLIGKPVLGEQDKRIGTVRNIIVNDEETIQSVLVSPGGTLQRTAPFWVPWKDVELSPNLDQVRTPVGPDTVGRYSVFANAPLDVAVMAGSYRVTELVDTFATFAGREGYGLVEDLVFSPEGKLIGLVVQPGKGADPARYSLPYDETYYDRAVGLWRFPFSTADLAVLRPFEEDSARD